MTEGAASHNSDTGADSHSGACHVAIIMDGNGRWAKQRGMPRAVGHERGVEALRRIVDGAGSLGITHLTVFSFSTENWRRPAEEVSALFGLLKSFVKRDLAKLHQEGVRVKVIGRRDRLPDDILRLIDHSESLTSQNERFHLTIAFNYGSRDEIVTAAKQIAQRVKDGDLEPDDLSEEVFENHLQTFDLPELDLLVRTSGEYRISNFLLWQLAYSELVFTDVLWPDYTVAHLADALENFQRRDRRFGAVEPRTA